MTKTTKKLSKIFLILTPFSSLIFLQSASYELPVYNLEVRTERVWGKLTEEEKSWFITNNNFDFDLGQSDKDWKIVVGLNSPYGGYTGQNDVVKQFSPNWFSQNITHIDRLCFSTGYNCGAVHFSKTTILDGVYDINTKPNNSIPNDNFEIDLQDIIYGTTTQKPGEKFTYFFDHFNISLRRGNSYYQFVFHEGINGLGKEFTDSFNKDNRGQFNLRNIKLSFRYTVKNNKISELTVTIRADVEYKIQEQKENEQNSQLNNYLSGLQNSFEETFRGKYEIPTDSGATGGINTPKPTPTNRDTNVTTIKSNREYWDEKIKNWWDTATKNNPQYNAKFDWSYWTASGDIAWVWVTFDDPLDNQRKKFWLSNPKSEWSTQWKPTKFFLQREFSSRLELIPSTVLKYDEKLKRLVQIKADRKQIQANQQPNSSTSQTAITTNDQANVYGGEFEFVGDVKVKFNGAKDNSEVLFINGKKIDVLDNQFETVLQDLRLEQKENGGTNKYKIEIKKFKKDKSEVEKSYSIDLITKSVVNVLQGKWFGWEPEKNIEQKKLISEFLLDDSGNVIVGQDGKKLENPDYDPNIDPQTGTKKQILWVKNNGQDLRDNIFYQDSSIGNGFIAEAAVAGKGINLTFRQNFQDDKATIKRYKINQSEKKKFSLLPQATTFSSTPANNGQGQEIKINNNEFDYFSNSGLWLYRVGYEADQQAFKLFLIGDNDNTKLFSDIVNSDIYIPFWQSPAGKKLEKYLIQVRGFNNKYIEKLSYEKIIAHWKSYINYKYDKGEIQDPISSIISNRIDKALEDYLKKMKNIDFSNNQKIQLKDIDFSEILQYLTDKQKAKLKDIEITPFKNGRDWVFHVDSDFRQTLGLSAGVFEFPGLKTDQELKDLQSTKKEIKVENLEEKVQELVNKYAFVKPQELINRVSVLVNSELDENVATISKTTAEGVFEVKLITDDEHFVAKDQFKFNLKKLQEKAQDNYNVFNVLPKDIKVNLKGATTPEQAAREIKHQLQLLTNNQLNFGQNYSFDPKLLNNLALFNVYQGDFDSAKSQGNLALSGIDLPGYINLHIVNVVPNISPLKEKNLSKIKINDIKINSNNPQKIAEQLRDELNKQLAPWGLNWEEYLNPGDFNKILEQIQHNKFSEVVFQPSNYLTDGNLKFNVENFDFVPYNFNLPTTEEATSFIQDKKNLYWFIPLTITVFGILSFGIWFLIRKKFKKFN
ncbi:Mbov_0399 family ICE element protein [Mesomycoplasma ovipneumoniae]|uniref:Mbov_0399 family ICE element protein n=1 Tax=Mesomycoplasma ovipneumoniae TaxID=29562 RepID=UPI0028A8BA3E|nr:hypothetical protein [Mesomycoplasma ovipneumoniae]WNM16705.1 hypothetical protein RNM19_01000 [Mesomycoplasma ovipneumoniae]